MLVNREVVERFAGLNKEEALKELETKPEGLTETEATRRIKRYGENTLPQKKKFLAQVFIKQFTDNPLILILASATFISFLLGDRTTYYYIFGIISISIFLGFWNEYTAERTVEDLLKRINRSALIIRGGERLEVAVAKLTIGDLVVLVPGTIFPADLRIIEARNLEVDESTLTGESRTVFKSESSTNSETRSGFKNVGFMGTSVVSGSGSGVVIQLAGQTEYGQIVRSTSFLKPVTEFQKGLAQFGRLIIKVVFILTTAIFIINSLLGHPILNSLLFALAIAVGLTPELLPVIVTVSLSHGAGRLAKKHAVAKQLISIENFGNIDVLCADKTGTLTEGRIRVVDYRDPELRQNEGLLKLALNCNTAVVHHKVTGNAIDAALWEYALEHKFKPEREIKKLEQVPFDFNRKMMYSVVSEPKGVLIVKGAPEAVLAICRFPEDKESLVKLFHELNDQGLRLISLAKKEIAVKESYSWADAFDLSYQGYVSFLDVPKKSAPEALARLRKLNVEVKIITGDNEIVTGRICKELGLRISGIVNGEDLDVQNGEQFRQTVNEATVFSGVTPQQKLRIIETLKEIGHTVGYLGDGINDIPPLRRADVGISVNTADDATKETASVVLLRKGLDVLADAIIEGRRTFNNTVKYLLMATSSNFGNMFSAAGVSFLLPFLPMTPTQILLNNTLYDLSQTAIPGDGVDPESLLKPRHWNIEFIRSYMLYFGPLSSIFDFLTFVVLLQFFHAKNSLFQTGWFVESVATQVLVVFVIRTARTPFFRSRPSRGLLLLCLSVVGVAVLIPFTPLAPHLNLVRPPFFLLAVIALLTVVYLGLVELVKNFFLKRHVL